MHSVDFIQCFEFTHEPVCPGSEQHAKQYLYIQTMEWWWEIKKKKSTQLGKIPFSDTDTSTKLFIQMKVKNACVHFCQTAVHRIDNSTQESK